MVKPRVILAVKQCDFGVLLLEFIKCRVDRTTKLVMRPEKARCPDANLFANRLADIDASTAQIHLSFENASEGGAA
ncbi:hypothetical protein D3C80_1948720 [compost metagenome]